MKKNFFKKLSFVLALAMIVTALAPAAGAFAAKAPKLNASTKTLHLGVDGKDEFDFNISNKVTGWKYLWSSANEDVVSVNKKNGLVTAEAAGTTKVSVVITDKDGEEVDELTATVLVRDNIKELTITNLPKDGKVAVGAEHDFNRSYVTVANKTKGSQAITRWSVDPSEGATINDKGVFTATKAGEYTITARAFQSKAKYTSWLADATKYASYVTSNEATYKVTVAASMVKAEQVDLDTFKVTFDSAVTDAATKLSVFTLYGTAEVSNTIKKVTMSADNKEATVDMYVPFVEEKTILVKYPEVANVQFVAAKAAASEVTKIEITTTTVAVGTAKEIGVKFLNKDGVDLAKSDLYTRLTWASSNSAALMTGSDHKLIMFKVGDTTTLTATFHTYNYDSKTGTEIGNLVATQVVTCVDKSKDNYGIVNAYSVIPSANTPDYSNAKHSVAASDASYKLFVELKGTEADGDELKTYNYVVGSSTYNQADWKFTSSDISILNIDPQSGVVYPYKAGTVVIVIKYKDVEVGTATITVTDKREAATVTLSANQFNLSNNNDVQDVKSVDVKVKDQLGEDYGNFTSYIRQTSNNSGNVYVAGSSDNDTVFFNGCPAGVTGTELAKGTYTYEVKIVDNNSKKEIFSYITVTLEEVPAAEDDVAYRYALETDKTEYDMKLTGWDKAEDVKVQLFSYASNGVKNQRLDINASGVALVKNPKDADVTAGLTAGSGSYNAKDGILSLVTVSGGMIQKAEKGTYTVTAKDASGSAIAATYFVVGDSQPVAVAQVNKYYTNKNNVLDAIKDCLKVTVDGVDKTATITATGYTLEGSQVTSGNAYQIRVKEVFIDLTYDVQNIHGTYSSSTLRLKADVNATLTYNYGN